MFVGFKVLVFGKIFDKSCGLKNNNNNNKNVDSKKSSN